MKRRTSLVIVMTGLFGLLLAGPVIAADGSVTIREADERYAFSPGTVYVNVGDSVTWTNDTDAPHNVTSDTGDELASTTSATARRSTTRSTRPARSRTTARSIAT